MAAEVTVRTVYHDQREEVRTHIHHDLTVSDLGRRYAQEASPTNEGFIRGRWIHSWSCTSAHPCERVTDYITIKELEEDSDSE